MLEGQLQIKEIEEKIEKLMDSEYLDPSSISELLDELDKLESELYNGMRLVE